MSKKTTKKPAKKTQTEPKPNGREKVAEKAEFVKFIALPKVLREEQYGYDELKDFAHKYKLDPTTLTAWQKQDSFWRAVKKTWRVWGKNRTPDVILGLYKRASKEGKANEARAWFELIEEEDVIKRLEALEDAIKNK